MPGILWDVPSHTHLSRACSQLLPNDGGPRAMGSLQKLWGVLYEDRLDGGLYGLTSACFGRGCLFLWLNDRVIFICSLIVFLGLSGRSQLFLSLEVCLTCFLKRCLDMVEELFRTCLVKYSDRQGHLVRHLNLVDHLGGVHGSKDIGDGWCRPPWAPFTLLWLEAFWVWFVGRHQTSFLGHLQGEYYKIRP